MSSFPSGDARGAPPMMSPRAPGAMLTDGHEAPDRTPATSTRAAESHYNRGNDPAKPVPDLSRSFLMSRGPAACTVNPRVVRGRDLLRAPLSESLPEGLKLAPC